MLSCMWARNEHVGLGGGEFEMETRRCNSRFCKCEQCLCDDFGSHCLCRCYNCTFQLVISKIQVTRGYTVVDLVFALVTVSTGGVKVEDTSIVVVVVVVTNSVVEVTIVEVDWVVTITGWWVSVTIAKNPCPGGEMKSLLIHQYSKRL